MIDLASPSYSREDRNGNNPSVFYPNLRQHGEYHPLFGGIDSSLDLKIFYDTDGLLMWGEEDG